MRRENFNFSCYLLAFGLLYFSSGFLCAQSAEFVASVSARQVVQHNIFEVQFELRNAEGSSFQPPSFKDFKIVAGPSLGSSTMIINGVVSRSQSWSYSLLATQQGTFTIPSANIVVGRKKLTTRPIEIKVLAQHDQITQRSGAPGKDQIILVAETRETAYYPGQQIILTYKLLFRENVQTVNTIAEDDYADFYIQHFPNFSREPSTETVNGIPYTSRIIKSMALFAHQSGTYTIEPMIMNAGINAPFPGNQGFFTMRRIMDVQVASQPLTISILPLPPDDPPFFSGAVGHYELNLQFEKTQLTTDEAFTFQLEMTGNGDARRLDVPRPFSEGTFEIFEPNILVDRVYDDNNVLLHARTIEYHMVPEKPGDYKVYVPFTYFDPVVKAYKTITSDTVLIKVTPGSGVRMDSLSKTHDKEDDLPLMPTGRVWLSDNFWRSMPHLLLFSLLISGSGYGLWLNHKRKGLAMISTTERIRQIAGSQARDQIDELSAQISDLSTTAFFERATEIYYRFLTNRFMIPASELDETSVGNYLRKTGIPEDIIQKAVRFFNQCLEVRYGGIPGGYTREEMLLQCRELTDRLGE